MNLKRFFTLLLCVPLIVLGSCSKNDSTTVDAANLIGKWECYKDYDGEYDEWDYDYGEGIHIWRLEFRSYGTVLINEDGHNLEHIYKLEGTTLVMYAASLPDETDEARIEQLTASELVLAYDYMGDNGRHCTDKEYYKRID